MFSQRTSGDFSIWKLTTLDDNVDFVIFTFAEGNVAIAAACAPLLASQWNWTIRKIRSSLGSQSGASDTALKHDGPRSSDEGRGGQYTHGQVTYDMNTPPHGSQKTLTGERQEYEKPMTGKEIESARWRLESVNIE